MENKAKTSLGASGFAAGKAQGGAPADATKRKPYRPMGNGASTMQPIRSKAQTRQFFGSPGTTSLPSSKTKASAAGV